MSELARSNGKPIPGAVEALRKGEGPVMRTVAELRALLADLPGDLPLGGNFSDGKGVGVSVVTLIPYFDGGPWQVEEVPDESFLQSSRGLTRGLLFLSFSEPENDPDSWGEE